MRILYINRADWLEELKHELLKLGHEIVENDPDVILGMTNSMMNESEELYKQYPNAVKIQYNWDLYEWFFTNPREGEYDWNKYISILGQSDAVWCPSQEVVKRMEEKGLNNGKVIKTYIVPFEEEVSDERYVLMPIRELPDRQYSWFKRACEELRIPYIMPNHQLNTEDYRKIVARCSFIVSHLYEASTGGLTLLEGYYLGKPVLISDTFYMGAKDYFGNHAYYFLDYEDLKNKIKFLWDNTPKLNREECRDWVLENYSVTRMAKEVDDELRRIQRQIH